MRPSYRVYVEVGKRRTFACAFDWPGWCRSARAEDAALGALVAYGPRYAAAVGSVEPGFTPPTNASDLEVIERLEGNSTTDFGAPAVAPAGDDRPLDETDADRLASMLKACWAYFDEAARAASGTALRKGPRGGGREVDAIVSHVLEAEKAYLSLLGGRYAKTGDEDVTTQMSGVRAAVLEAVSSGPTAVSTGSRRRSATLWGRRYGVRRSAWHALDHAWEVEDRATQGPTGGVPE